MIPGGSQGNVNRKFACDQNDHRSKNRILYRQARAAIGLIVATSPQSDLANCRSGYDYPDVQFSLQTGKSSVPTSTSAIRSFIKHVDLLAHAQVVLRRSLWPAVQKPRSPKWRIRPSEPRVSRTKCQFHFPAPVVSPHRAATPS